MSEATRYTVTAALPYANGPIHIGHLAGVYIPADIFSRYKRRAGCDVLYVCGSDEHGVPITIKARKNKITPKQVIDKYHELIKRSFDEFGISFDIYHRTSDPLHHNIALDFFKELNKNGHFIEKESEEYFDKKENMFLADRYIKGTCPICSFADAYGDQCESCGTSLHPSELKFPQSVLSGGELTKKLTKHFYLPLDKYEQWLKDWILVRNGSRWKTNVLGQCRSWIEGGLKPRAVTRDLDWGVKIPFVDDENKVLYVWFDAPIGYISSTQKWAQNNNVDWKPYWCNNDTKLIHFIGKDNIVFHCIIFPAMLKAHGGYILPDNVPANEFLNLEGKKISTSREWAVWLHEYLIDFPNFQDSLRYVLCVNAPESKDNDFTWKEFQSRNNNELVAILGNFVNRVFVLIHKYWGGRVPKRSKILEIDIEIIDSLRKAPEKIGQSIEKYKFRQALQNAMDLTRLGNKYLADTEPWKMFKEDTLRPRTETVLNIALQLTATISIVFEPFLPFTSKKLIRMLNIDLPSWDEAGTIDIIKAGHEINNPDLLFSIIDDETIEKQIQKLKK